jgi:hypothetical protein
MAKAAFIMVLTILTLSVEGRPTDAMLIPSEDPSSKTQASQRVHDLQTIQQVLEMKVLQQRLADWGFSPDEISSKLGGLSDEQVHYFAQQIESVMVGGFHGTDDLLHGGLLSILVIAAIVLLVLLLI